MVMAPTKRLIRLACFLAVTAVSAGAQTAESAAEVLARARAAVGHERLRSLSKGVVAEGVSHSRGLDSKFMFLFMPDGRYRTEIEGLLGGVSGFDGAVSWEVDWSGMPRVLEFEDLEDAQFNAWVFSGRWLAENGPFSVTLDGSKTDDKRVALRLKLKNGVLEATALLDRATWLPRSFTRRTVAGEEVVELDEYRESMGFRLPHRVTRAAGGVKAVYEIRSISAAPRGSATRFKRVTARPGDTRWDASAARIEVRRAKTGHLLVHPLVEGEDAGWFILDSGAGVMVIDKKVADRLGMPAFGEIVAVGVAGTTKSRFRRGGTFRLGPMTMSGTRYLELDLDFLTKAFGLPVGGICGRDLFARAAVEINISAEAVALHDPSRYRLSGASWQELFFSGRNPAVRARFEGGREGLFRLDTGSDRTVSLHAPAVERYNLLSGRETRESRSGGVGGSRPSRSGRLAWFELAGHRLEDLDVEFASAGEGAFSDVYMAGNIGAGILRNYRIVFDYGNKRVALEPLKAAKAAGAGAP